MADVVKGEDGTWGFTCPRTDGSCGPFTSTGWPTKASAAARLAEHTAEHEDGTPMSAIEDFRAAQGLTVDGEGRAVTRT